MEILSYAAYYIIQLRVKHKKLKLGVIKRLSDCLFI